VASVTHSVPAAGLDCVLGKTLQVTTEFGSVLEGAEASRLDVSHADARRLSQCFALGLLRHPRSAGDKVRHNAH
jgi:hypothetical protein